MLKEFRGMSSAKDTRLKQLYRSIRKLGFSDISALKEETGFKSATCARMLDELLLHDLIDDSEVGQSSGGRRPKIYRIKASKYVLIGVEISHLFTTVLLQDLNLEILMVEKLKMGADSTPQFVMDFVSESIEMMLDEVKIPREKLLGIGIGVLARIDKTNNSIVDEFFFKDLDWQGFDLIKYLQKENPEKILIDSATNLAALAEYRKNYWNNADSLLFVSSDLIIRSAAIFNGQLLYKESEMVESFGHMIVDVNGEQCTCGAYGCIQMYSTLPVIYKQILKKIKMGNASTITDDVTQIDDLSYYHILQGIEDQDPLCLEVLKEGAFYFGIGLSNLVLQLQPKEVIIGGTLALRMFEPVEELVKNRLIQLGIDSINLHKASASYNTVSQGAGCMVLDYFIEEEIFI